jgi:GNAT superfamily N-acetyltransferase
MKITRLEPKNLEKATEIIIEAFGDHYQKLFAINPGRLKPFVRLNLAMNETIVLDDVGVKGVLVLGHRLHSGAGYGDIFTVLARTIPIWSVFYASRYILAPKHRFTDALLIDQIATAKAHQGKGYGIAMLEFAQSRCLELGLSKIALQVRGDNPAKALYERFGFKTEKSISSFFHMWSSGCREAVFMSKTVCS